MLSASRSPVWRHVAVGGAFSTLQRRLVAQIRKEMAEIALVYEPEMPG
jgi:hypothetical protein